ncbi:MAG: Co2+/Mg2+ efflux protein ApaG [Cyclobacteriaceae bacterium]|nr:Co2+/Mg2+ efflux protein ApaG [Cyclobacteriaceae bacterium]
MTTDITKGVKVTVETEYHPEYSNPVQQHYVFTYRITIENLGDKTIQLKSRHWEIVDSIYPKREIDGEGVVGKQPVLDPGEIHQYVSGCNLRSGIGKMFGYYTMERISDGRRFFVNIPEFTMVVPMRLN